MGSWTHLPFADWRNDGWGIVGGGGSLWNTWNNDNDSQYAQCPAYKGYGACTFPVDITQVPDGAVITSITVQLRCATGTGTPPTNTPPSVTIQTGCTDDTSRFTSRTIYPTSTITTYEVATYQRDCLGLDWDIHRINKLICRVFSYVGIFDLIRCYKFYVVIKYRVRPTITVDAPSGTVLTPSPTISWTYSQTDGDPQTKVKYRLFTGVQQSDVSFDPGSSPCVFEDTLNGDISSVVLPTSIDPDTYWVYVRSTSSFGAKSVWTGRQFQVQGPAPNPPGVPDPTGATAPGVGIIQTVPDSFNGSAQLTLRDSSNLLSVQAADAETGTDQSEFLASNCAITRDTSTAFPGGTSSWKMSSTASGNMSITSAWVEVAPSTPITARAQYKTAASARSANVAMWFYDQNFGLLSTTTGSSVTDSAGTWTEATATVTTPSTAAYVKLVGTVLATGAASEVHNVDHLGLMYGTGTPWSDGGHMSRNLLSAWYSNAEGSALNGEAWTPNSATTVGTATPPGTGGSGATANKMTYVGLSPTLGIRATGTVFTTPTSGTDYTLNKPVGTASGDLMLAFVTSTEYSNITPPAGWVLVDQAKVDDGSQDTALFILKRSAGGAEPTTWTDGSVSVASARRAAVVVSYSGAADASTQFITEGQVSTPNNLPAYITTPTVYNTDPNAWRVSAFAFNNNVTGGTMVANTNQPSTVPPITFVGKATVWKDNSSQTSFTINRPVGVQSGDLMIATVGFAVSGATITAPTGWTTVNNNSGTNGPFTQVVFKRTAGASEPTSWAGTISGGSWPNTNLKMSQALAYRNCLDASSQFVSSGQNFVGGASSLNTLSLSNSNSGAWRVVAFGADADNAGAWSLNETSKRADDTYAVSFSSGLGTGTDSVTVAMADSNTSVSTGSYTMTGTLNESFYNAGAWMGFIAPLSTPPVSGANETQRAQTTVGSANPWITLGVFDSNTSVPTGSQSVSGIYTPGSGSGFQSAAGWIGIIKPATPVRAGQAGVSMSTTVDISTIDPSLLALSGNQAAITASFIGSTAGTPYLTVNFYRANQLINSFVAQGNSFGTGTWVKSAAAFSIPDGTTRMSLGLSVTDRAVNDIVYYDRVSLALGGDTVHRGGTYRSAHPIWAAPQIQYADDDGTGYGPWQTLPGTVTNPPSYDALSGLVTYYDQTVIPLTNRKYRARTISYGLAGDTFVSSFGPESSEFSFVAENWWLKDISNSDNNLQLKVRYDNVTVGTTNTATVFQPLGEDLPVVLTEGYKGDSFTLTLVPVSQADYAPLRKLLKSGRTLFLQSDVDNAWWVRPIGDISADILATGQRQSNPLREIKVTFVQVAPEL